VELLQGIESGCGEGVPLMFDMARPTSGARPYPALVFVHGGAWTTGARQDYRSLMIDLSRYGFLGVSIDYRLAPSHAWPAQLADVRCAVRWLRANASRYGADPDRIGAVGGSAGAHLVAMLGLTSESAIVTGGRYGNYSSRISAMVLHGGLYDLRRAYRSTFEGGVQDPERARATLEMLLGGTPATAAGAYERASPITYANAGAPPALLVHGRRDTAVPVEQSVLLHRALLDAGASAELIVIEDAGHADFGRHSDAVSLRLLQFLRDNFVRPSSSLRKNSRFMTNRA
jgi:acetyl esterase/lipase